MASRETRNNNEGGLRQVLRALRYRNFRLFFGGQLISLTGTWLQQVAMSWLVYSMTNSAFYLGLVSFAAQLPSLVVTPFAGLLVDKWSRHRILILTQTLSMIQALVLAALTIIHVITLWQIIVLGVFLGLVNALDAPARQSFIVEMVERRSVLGLGRIIPTATIVFGVGLIALALTHTLWVALLLIMLAGIGSMLQMASSNTVIQTIVEDSKRGRVMSIYTMAFLGTAPIGSLVSGALASRIGLPDTFLIAGGVCILGAVFFASRLPALREVVRPIYIQIGILPEESLGVRCGTPFAVDATDEEIV